VNARKPPDSSPLARAPDSNAPGGQKAADLRIPEWARQLAVLLDGAITIPGTSVKIGLDPIIGLLLPELGDALTGVVSLTLLGVAYRERVPKLVMARMLVNIALDAILGAIPGLGDVFDFAFRANQKNLALIERHRRDPSHAVTWGDRLVVLGIGLVALALVALPIVLAVVLVRFLASLSG
jgi:Domain of unknown function (DUF4112)